jgi:hypothetical protein
MNTYWYEDYEYGDIDFYEAMLDARNELNSDDYEFFLAKCWENGAVPEYMR